MKRRMLGAALAIIASSVLLLAANWKVRGFSGIVLNDHGEPVAGATVRLRASSIATQTDSARRFVLNRFHPALKVRVTAWAEGYYITGRAAWPWGADVTLRLSPYGVADHTTYSWMPPTIEGRSIWAKMKTHALLDPTAAIAPDALFFRAA